MTYQDIAKIIPTIQAAHLTGKNIEVVNKKKTSTKDVLDLGVTNVVGTSLLKTNANLIAGL